jgi:hypothetical protein
VEVIVAGGVSTLQGLIVAGSHRCRGSLVATQGFSILQGLVVVEEGVLSLQGNIIAGRFPCIEQNVNYAQSVPGTAVKVPAKRKRSGKTGFQTASLALWPASKTAPAS